MFDQLVVGIVFSCFWLKNYKNIVLRYSITNKQYFCVEEFLKKKQKIVWMHSNGVCMTVRYHKKTCESWEINCVLRLSLRLCTQIMECEDKQAYKIFETGVLVWKSKNMKKKSTNFFLFLKHYAQTWK